MIDPDDLRQLRADVISILRHGQQISEMLQAVQATLEQGGEILVRISQLVEKISKENR